MFVIGITKKKKKEIGRTCSTHGREVHTGFQHDSVKERFYYEDIIRNNIYIGILLVKRHSKFKRTRTFCISSKVAKPP